MQVEVIEEDKKSMTVIIHGEDHTFCNALRDELNRDSKVAVAAYKIEHPLTKKPRVMVQMKSGDPKKALLDAATRLQKTFDTLKKAF